MRCRGSCRAGPEASPRIRVLLLSGDKSFEQSAAALNTLFANGVLSPDEFAARLIALARGEATEKSAPAVCCRPRTSGGCAPPTTTAWPPAIT